MIGCNAEVVNGAHASSTWGLAPLKSDDRTRARQTLAWIVAYRAQILASIAVVALPAGGLLYAAGEPTAGRMV